MDIIKNYLEFYDKDTDELIELSYNVTREHFEGRTVECCSIISAKTGSCPENCKYCSQSAHNNAKIQENAMLSIEEVKKAALSAKENGAKRFAIVTSGKKLEGKDFETVLEMIKEISNIDGMSACACLGLLDFEQMKALKEAGCTRYNHNINTSENYYKEICTTHTFKDRIDTIKLAEKAGMETCVGVIIGMGEDRVDRINMALTLRELNPKSVTINVLDPIEGTPFENFEDKIDEEEILKTICIFRLILPTAYLKYAGGRAKRISVKYQKLGLLAGINGLIVGNMLTTAGMSKEIDDEILDTLGFERE